MLGSIARGLTFAASATLASCGLIPVPENPALSFTAWGTEARLSGNARMQSRVSGGGKRPNPSADLRSELNMSDRDTGVGGKLAWGDGFQGVEFSFLHWETKNFDRRGTLATDFGDLQTGDSVTSTAELDQYKLEWVSKVWEFSHDDAYKAFQSPFRADEELRQGNKDLVFRWGLGVGLHHNDFAQDSFARNAPRRQVLDFADDGIPMLLGRFETAWKPFALRVDVGWTDGDWGEIEGRMWDLEVRASYRIQRRVEAWVGYMRYDLPGKGAENGLEFEYDADLSGWIAGLKLSF